MRHVQFLANRCYILHGLGLWAHVIRNQRFSSLISASLVMPSNILPLEDVSLSAEELLPEQAPRSEDELLSEENS